MQFLSISGIFHYLEHESASPHVLVLHELHGVFPLLLRVVAEELCEAVQGNIVTVEVGSLKEIENFLLASLKTLAKLPASLQHFYTLGPKK